MAEGINFNTNGTISFPINGETFTLRRPTSKQLFDLWDLVDEIADDAREYINGLVTQLAELKDDDSDEATELLKKIQKERRHVHELTTIPWLKEAFKQVGSAPFPEDLTNAPSEIVDPSLPQQVLDFWRRVPLAQSDPRRR